MKKLLVIGTSITALSAGPALATEGQTQQYPIGVNTVAAGNFPTPGMLQFLNYVEFQDSPHVKDAAGHNSVSRFHLNAIANAARLLYTWKPPIGPFHFVTGLVVPFAYLDLKVENLHGNDFGIGNINFQNYIGYASHDRKIIWHAGLDAYFPTGNYIKDAVVNTGLNFWTFAPNYNITYNPSKRLELTGTVFPEFNTTNHATRYHSGNDITIDYGLSYRPWRNVPHLGIGLQGYFYRQINNDTGPTVTAGGNQGQEFAIGPQIRYDIPFGGVILKYQHEFAVRNRPSGEKVWFEFAFPLFGAVR